MRRLTIIGATPNGDGVILSDDKGAKFLVANDPRLAAAIQHMTPRQLETALQTFSPREVQSRVRAGASAEVVAAETGWPMEKVLRYAEPLLAERAYIAGQAQHVEVRRSGGGATLLESAATALGDDPESAAISWDAWRREDGKWVITAIYRAPDGAQTAQWTYDPAGRNIHPLDDQARLLMGARPIDTQAGRQDAIDDALDMIAERRVESSPEPGDARRRLVAVPDAPVEDTDDAHEATGASAEDTAQTVTIAHAGGTEAGHDDESAAADAPEPIAKPAPRKAKSRKGRASVPSWDEILFGTSRPDE